MKVEMCPDPENAFGNGGISEKSFDQTPSPAYPVTSRWHGICFTVVHICSGKQTHVATQQVQAFRARIWARVPRLTALLRASKRVLIVWHPLASTFGGIHGATRLASEVLTPQVKCCDVP